MKRNIDEWKLKYFNEIESRGKRGFRAKEPPC
jgi:hypothetical protein